MTTLPTQTNRKLGLVIDLDTCVGCHACVISCKGWNTENYGAPLSDQDAYGGNPSGTFLNRVHSYEMQPEQGGAAQLVHFPKSCLHCEDAPCVTVCPTGASYKRVEDGIVLVNESDCIGCGLCAWACPYGARELDAAAGVMKKCTLCVDRIYNENKGSVTLLEASTEGFRQRSQFTPAPQSEIRASRGKVWTHPVVAEGRLYLRDQDLIYCYRIK